MNGMRIESLEVEHFKNIDKKIVSIGGRSFIITGKNGAGKSSLIQAITSAMDGNVKQPKSPIKKGEEKGFTRVVIKGDIGGEEHEYTLEMFYTPGNQTGRLVVKNAKGETLKSPAKTLDAIIGDISFDIFKFLNSTGPQKVKVLKELGGVGAEIDKLDAKRKELMAEKLFKTKSCDEKEAILNNHGLSQDDIDKYSEPIPVEPIQEELTNISKKIESFNKVKNGVADYKKQNAEIVEYNKEGELEITELENKIKEIREKIASNAIEFEKNEDLIKKGNEWLEKHPEPKADEISKRLSVANVHNENHANVIDLGKKQIEIVKLKQDIEKLVADVKKCDEDKIRIIRKSKLPIKDLTFDDDQVYLEGLPFEEGQINTAKLYKAGFEISKALNPNLRTIFVHSGSLFDKDSLLEVIKDAEKDGYQVIAECVSDEADVAINFIEHD